MQISGNLGAVRSLVSGDKTSPTLNFAALDFIDRTKQIIEKSQKESPDATVKKDLISIAGEDLQRIARLAQDALREVLRQGPGASITLEGLERAIDGRVAVEKRVLKREDSAWQAFKPEFSKWLMGDSKREPNANLTDNEIMQISGNLGAVRSLVSGDKTSPTLNFATQDFIDRTKQILRARPEARVDSDMAEEFKKPGSSIGRLETQVGRFTVIAEYAPQKMQKGYVKFISGSLDVGYALMDRTGTINEAVARSRLAEAYEKLIPELQGKLDRNEPIGYRSFDYVLKPILTRAEMRIGKPKVEKVAIEKSLADTAVAIAENQSINRLEARTVKVVYEERGEEELYDKLKAAIVEYHKNKRTEPGIDQFVVDAREENALRLLDLIKPDLEMATAEQKITIGLALGEGTENSFKKTLFEILDVASDVGTAVIDGHVDRELSAGLRERNVNPQPVKNMASSREAIDQAGVPVAVLGSYNLSDMNDFYIPFRVKLERYKNDPLAQDNAQITEMVSVVFTGRLVSKNPELKNNPEGLKAALINELGKIAAFKDIVKPINGYFEINGDKAWLAVLEIANAAREAAGRAA